MTALEELRTLEPVFHRLPAIAARADIERMTAPEFWEVGASGSVYSRDHVLSVVEQRLVEGTARDPGWKIDDFDARELASGLWLATYRLDQDDRLSRRATLWRCGDLGWQVVYHQGTLVEDGSVEQ